MPATKAAQPVFSGVTTTQSSSPIDVSTAYAIQLCADVTNGSGITAQATIQVQISPDNGTTYYSPGALLFGFGLAAGNFDLLVDVPVAATKVKVQFTQATGGTATINAQLGLVTGV